jgi:signal peptidase I, archaeal type
MKKPIRVLKKIFIVLSWVFTVAILLIASFVFWGNKNGWQFAAILSGSMEPKIHVGGLVVIKPVDVKTLKVGDIISFMSPSVSADTPICHRIIAIRYIGKQEYFQTKGDANEDADWNMVAVNDIKGKAVFYTPFAGQLVKIHKLGTKGIPVLGMELPLAIILVTTVGSLIIGLILKDLIESILWPGKQWQKEAAKKRKQIYTKRRKFFNL